MITKPPIPASAVSDQWIADCREAINQRDGVPIRANPAHPCIDTYVTNTKTWIPLMIPGSGTMFTTTAERDVVLRKLEGK